MLHGTQQIDPEKKLFDLIALHGAANVQKAGALIEQHFPQCSVIVGIEHTVSLLFGKAMAVRPMQEMCQFAKLMSVVVCLLIVCNVTLITILSFYFTSSEMYSDQPAMFPMQCSRRYPRFTTMVGFCSSLNHRSAGWEGRHYSC